MASCKFCGKKEPVLYCVCAGCMDKLRPQWISVKERTPKPATKVIVYWENSGGPVICEGYYMGEDGWSYVGWEAPRFIVTHWMPLPSPPEEGEADE